MPHSYKEPSTGGLPQFRYTCRTLSAQIARIISSTVLSNAPVGTGCVANVFRNTKQG